MRGDASHGGHSSTKGATEGAASEENFSPEAVTRSGAQAVAPSLVERLSPGAVVNDKYRILSILGRGSMGIVAECEHLELRERVALKFLLTRGNVAGEDFRVRFTREAQLSAKLKGRHIARVVDVGVWLDSLPYMVMEYLDGTDLAQVLRDAGRLPLDVALDFAVQICEGVAEAHALGVVHRDLKPSNVFVTRQADGSDLIKILDFGVSKWDVPDRDDEGTQAGLVLGSPKYMAPEQMFAASTVDARADVWSIGAVLYQMIAGRPPFDFSTFAQTFAAMASDRVPSALTAQIPEVPPELERAIFRCFERVPDRRAQSVAELAGALLEAVRSPLAASIRTRVESILSSRSNREGGAGESSSSSRIRIAPHDAAAPVWLRGSAMETSSSVRMRTDAQPQEEAPPPKKRHRWAAVALALVGAASFAGFATPSILRTRAPAEPRADGPPAASSIHEAALAPSVDPAATGAPGATPSSAAVDAAPDTTAVDPRATGTRTAPLRAHAPPTPRPSASAASGASVMLPSVTAKVAEPVKKNCDPPYVLSSDGVKTYKPECF